jgi:hypothetical protein
MSTSPLLRFTEAVSKVHLLEAGMRRVELLIYMLGFRKITNKALTAKLFFNSSLALCREYKALIVCLNVPCNLITPEFPVLWQQLLEKVYRYAEHFHQYLKELAKVFATGYLQAKKDLEAYQCFPVERPITNTSRTFSRQKKSAVHSA